MGAAIDPGFALKQFPSSIVWDSKPGPYDHESSLLITRPDFFHKKLIPLGNKKEF